MLSLRQIREAAAKEEEERAYVDIVFVFVIFVVAVSIFSLFLSKQTKTTLISFLPYLAFYTRINLPLTSTLFLPHV